MIITRLGGAAALVAGIALLPSLPFADTTTTSEGVDVTTHGTFQVRAYQDQGRGESTFAVHAVQRVESGTVVYFSVGWADDAGEVSPIESSEIVGTQIGGRYSGGDTITGVRIVERSAGRVLSTLREPEKGVLTNAFASESESFPTEPGQMAVLFAVLPELDPTTETVDVQLAYGHTVPDVPVGEGLLEPALPTDEPIPLGTGWPEVDLEEVAEAPEPGLSVHQLVTVVQSIDLSTTTTETPEQVSVDVAADVLFAFDSADLTPAATSTLEAVGVDVVARAAGGTLRIVGHTDSVGTDAYNEDLSLRRAQAAAQALAPAAAEAGLTVVAEGRGEREPVADNGSDEGKQANRRVTVTFDITDGGRP